MRLLHLFTMEALVNPTVLHGEKAKNYVRYAPSRRSVKKKRYPGEGFKFGFIVCGALTSVYFQDI